MLSTSEIRQSFHDFFEEKSHKIVSSASLLPTSPNLLFTNAGMNQFVPYFIGERKSPDKRVADTQKCIRAGGKHNDLEDVGLDTYHHTFFEMLGNWSFDDYFKKEAIEWAWELIAEVWKFPKERLYATIYKPAEGDPANEDDEARRQWTTIFQRNGLDPSKHVLTGGKKDNFWMMGETGPCGPCSELHVDLTPKGDTSGALVNKDSPYCIEIWNLVFIQFNAEPDGTFFPLTQNHVDTGMGLERVAGILATTEGFTRFDRPPSNYDSDIFQKIFSKINELGAAPYGGTMPLNSANLTQDEFHDCAFRVLADHIRALTFSIADGILPGNEGRNYVLRRIIRRALMYARKLKLPDGSFSKLAPTVIETMGDTFPEIINQREIICKVLQSEENSFGKTLKKGLQLLDRIAKEGSRKISGEDAFTLYDTYGFPLDLTQLVAREKELDVDVKGFRSQMEKQRERGRKSQKKQVVTMVSATGKATKFTGFGQENLRDFDAKIVGNLSDDRGNFLILNQTPFYAEMGGQVGDSGEINIGGKVFHIAKTIRDASGRHLHQVDAPITEDVIDRRVVCSVSSERRQGIQCHHTATHLLNWALRQILGNHVKQAGSLVENNRLRFDFSHFEPIDAKTLIELEKAINRIIIQNVLIKTFETGFDEKPKDVIAFFGDKYGDKVRIVDIGGFSKELCGGCHVRRTGELGFFKIISETGISAGTRRIEAITAHTAHSLALDAFQTINEFSRLLNCQQREAEQRLETFIEERGEIEKQLKALQQKEMSQKAADLGGQVQGFEGLKLIINFVEGKTPKEIQSIAVGTYKNTSADILVLGGTFNKKIFLNVLCSQKAISKGFDAGDILKGILQKVGGNGGGKADFATGGGKDNGDLAKVLGIARGEPSSLKNS
ncbi:MAG: alanine--tRNA ligase [Opitutae bacterium]|nr:alanine--tRNA ligase [Opitutae bacterium]MBT7852881.1 alanine--tRNA ligase [Opitutae bacterium]